MIDIKRIDATLTQSIDLKEDKMKRLFIFLKDLDIQGGISLLSELTNRIKITSDKYGELTDICLGSKLVRDVNGYMNGYCRLQEPQTCPLSVTVVKGVVIVNFDLDEIDNSLHIYDKSQFTLDYTAGNTTAGNILFSYEPTESEMRYIPTFKEVNMLAGTGKQEKKISESNLVRLGFLPDDLSKNIQIFKNSRMIFDSNGYNGRTMSKVIGKNEIDINENIDIQLELPNNTTVIDLIPAKHLIKETLSSVVNVVSYNGGDSVGMQLLEMGLTPNI